MRPADPLPGPTVTILADADAVGCVRSGRPPKGDKITQNQRDSSSAVKEVGRLPSVEAARAGPWNRRAMRPKTIGPATPTDEARTPARLLPADRLQHPTAGVIPPGAQSKATARGHPRRARKRSHVASRPVL